MRRELSVGVASVVLSAGAAFPSIERSIEVAQPIVTEAEEICVRNVTYITLSHESWGEVVDFTCNQNFVMVSGWEKPVNRNAANLARLKAKTDIYHFQEQALYGDTLCVVLDLSAMDVSKSDFDAADVVQATLDCVLINATRGIRGWVREASDLVAARHLRVDVEGSEEFAHLSRTYSFEELLKDLPPQRCYGLD